VGKQGQCAATKRDGSQCRGTSLPGKAHCFAHDPDLANARRQWTRDAGKAKSNKARMRKQLGDEVLSLGEIDSLLCVALKGVLAGKIEPGVATTAATVAKSISQLRMAADIEKRLEEVEKQAGLRPWSA
jgi:hypothetical protein